MRMLATTCLARRHATALCLQELPAPWRQRLTWQDLLLLPHWLVSESAPSLARLALWCGALWHGPALRQCMTGTVLQAAHDLLGPAGLQAVRDHAQVGRVRVMPVPARLRPAWLACGWDVLRADVTEVLEDRGGAQDLACCLVAYRAGRQAIDDMPPPGPALSGPARGRVSEVVSCACDLLEAQGDEQASESVPPRLPEDGA